MNLKLWEASCSFKQTPVTSGQSLTHVGDSAFLMANLAALAQDSRMQAPLWPCCTALTKVTALHLTTAIKKTTKRGLLGGSLLNY